MSHGRRIGRIKLIIPEKHIAEKYLSVWTSKELHFHPEKFPQITGNNFFGKDQEINLEIGCGTGEHLTELAQKNPEQLYIGIDFSKRSTFYAVDLAQKAGLENIHFIFADFNRVIPYLSPDSISILFFHFPDPNYGAKNEKRKIFTEDFLSIIYPIFCKNGYLSLMTDQENLITEFLEILNLNENYQKPIQQEVIGNKKVISRFQKTWERVDRQIYHFVVKPILANHQ